MGRFRIEPENDLLRLFSGSAQKGILDELNFVLDAGDPQDWAWRDSDLNLHLHQLAKEHSGRPVIAFYHAGLVMLIRRHPKQGEFTRAFFELWRDHADLLLKYLNTRWLIAACDTFFDHGAETDKGPAFCASVLANTVKLYETERPLAASAPETKSMHDAFNLFDGITSFKSGRGDLIRNMIRRMETGFPNTSTPVVLLKEIMRRLHHFDTIYNRMDQVQTRQNMKSPLIRPLKVALFNDTASSQHFGCGLVMEQIRRLIAGTGAEIIFTSPLNHDWQHSDAATSAIEKADVVIVNGEGSFDHDSEHAKSLSEIAPYCRSKGKLAYLVNATIEAVSDAVLNNLRDFAFIWVRESGSAATLRAAGIAHSILPDLTLLATFDLPERPVKPFVFVDSVLPEVTSYLAGQAVQRGEPLWLMKKTEDGYGMAYLPIKSEEAKTTLRKTKMHKMESPAAFAAQLAQAENLATGRFHAVTFALILKLPFFACSSNTGKIDALIKDAGLSPDRLLAPGQPIPDPKPFSPQELTNIEAYIQLVRARSAEMLRMIF